MKKLFSLITAIALSTNLSLVGFAEKYAPITNVSIDNEHNTLIIEGYNISEKYKNIAVEILRDDAVWGLSTEGKNKVSEFNPTTDNILNYLLWFDQISNVGYNEKYKFEMPCYYGKEIPEFRVRFGEGNIVYFSQKTVENVNNAITAEEIEKAVRDDDYVWGSVSGYYNEMLSNNALKNKFWQKFLDEKNNLKTTGNPFDSTLEIADRIPDIINIIVVNNAVSAENLEEITESFIKADLINNNSAQLFSNQGCYSDNKYFGDYQKDKLIKELFENRAVYNDFEKFTETFSDKVLLYALCNNSSKYFADKILTNTDRLSDAQKKCYMSLSGEKKLNVCNIINASEKPYESINALAEALYEASENATKKDAKTPGTPSGGGGGGGGRVGTVSTPSASINSDKTQNSVKTFFDDMEEASWAKEAVNALVSKNIVSGTGKNNFAPNRNVTREEFVKMLVNALNLTEEGVCGFDDVSENAWYYPYIAAAVNYKIVTGEGNSFGVGKEISRQDMATMVYRALEKKGEAFEPSESDFSDNNEIAQYAKKPCAYVKKYGIMNGMGENKFMPKEKATRAQAAKVIFELMKKEGNI